MLQQTKFDYSLFGKVFNKGLDDKDDKKEGLLKRLKNIEKNQNVNKNDKNKKTNNESELSIYSSDVVHMGGIDILGSKDETQTSYLKDDLEVFFLGYTGIFDSDLKKCFENIASEEKIIYIDYELLSREITTPSKKTVSFLQKHGNLYDFLTNVLKNKSLNNVRLLQLRLLDDLMNGFNVCKKVNGANSATDLYLYLLGNPRRTVWYLLLNTPTDKNNKEI